MNSVSRAAFAVSGVLFTALLIGGLVGFNKVYQEFDRIHEQVGEMAKAKPIASCPSGQLVSAINNGVPVCSALSCRIVTERGLPPTFTSQPTCASDEFAMNGGGITHPDLCGHLGFIHTSVPTERGWIVDAYGTNSPWGDRHGADACTVGYATCCKFVEAGKNVAPQEQPAPQSVQ